VTVGSVGYEQPVGQAASGGALPERFEEVDIPR